VLAAIAVQEPTRLLQQLFYFIAHKNQTCNKINVAIKQLNKTIII